MVPFIARRLVWGLMTLLAVSVLVFAATEIIPGDAATAILGQQATPQAVAALRASLNLDQPAPDRYAEWLSNIARGDFGRSLTTGIAYGNFTGGALRGAPVWELIRKRLINSAILALAATLVTIPLAFLLGILSAVKPSGSTDTVISTVTLTFIAVPEFVVGAVLILGFAIIWPLFPPTSLIGENASVGEHARALVLPCLTLSAAMIALTARMLRGSMIEALNSEYAHMARLKGVPERSVIFRHALRNALVPTVQTVALAIAWLAGGIVVIEVIFDYPGIGALLASAVASRDFPVVQALVLFITVVYVVINLFADVVTILLVPKLRESGSQVR